MLKVSILAQTGGITRTYPTDAAERTHFRVGWGLSAFLLLGFAAATVAILNLSSSSSGLAFWEAALLALFAPALLILGCFAVPQGFRNLHSLAGKLVWWHWLWMLILLSTFVYRIRDSQLAASEPIDAWAVFRLLPEAIVAFWLLSRLLNRRTSWLQSLFQGLVGALCVYALACVTSSLWSVKPSWTLYKSCEYLLDVSVLAAALSVIRSVETYESLFNWVWTLCAVELMFTWFGTILWPNEAWDQLPTRLIGVFPIQSSNAIGASGAILAVIAFGRLQPAAGRCSQRSWNTVVFVFGIVSMLASKTRNAMAGFVVGVLLVLVVSNRAKIAAFITLVSGALLISASNRALLVDYLHREQNADQLESLTGRMQWWEFAWQQFTKHPLTGLGAYAGGKFAVLSKLGFGDTAHLHNDYLEAIVGTSIWGLIPLLIAILGTWWFLFRFLRNSKLKPLERQLAVEAIGVMGILTVRSFFNAEFVWHAPQYFLVILGYAELLRRRAKSGQLNVTTP
jgi:O-antigen ligase